MKQNRIGLYQAGVLTFFFTRSFFLMGLIPLLFQHSGIDSLISILLGTGIGLCFLWIYLSIIKKGENKHIINLIKERFPKPFAYLFITLLLLGLILLGSFLLSKIALFINYSYLENVSLFIITVTFLFLCCFMAHGGLETIARSTEIIFLLFVILFLLGLIGISTLVEPTRLKPFFSQEWMKIGISSLTYATTISIPLFFMTMIPISNIKNNKKISKIVLLGYLVGSFTIFLTFLFMIGTLGIDLAQFYQYPETAILKKVSYFKFIERVEGILSLTWLVDGLMTLSFLVYSLNETLTALVTGKIKTVFFIIFLLTIMILSSRITFSLEQLLLPFGLIFILIPIFVLLQLYLTKNQKKKD